MLVQLYCTCLVMNCTCIAVHVVRADAKGHMQLLVALNRWVRVYLCVCCLYVKILIYNH